jgi:nitrate reductase delta subunit
MMHPAAAVALGYRYPTPTSHRSLEAVVTGLSGTVRRRMADYVDAVGALELAEWEELHTATLDLSPLFVPYVGHVVWGENYRRGAFMADLKADMERIGVDLGGELPDHIEPVLRYIAEAAEPLTDLTDAVGGAVATMQDTLHGEAPKNPYRHLLAATAAVVEEYSVVTIRTRTANTAARQPQPPSAQPRRVRS